MQTELNNQVISLLQESRKIEAVKLVKDVLGLGLKEAKDYVDVLEAGGIPSFIQNESSVIPENISQQLINLMQEGRKIDAVKLVREYYNLGLKEAKDYVEALAEGKNPATPDAIVNSSLSATYGEDLIQAILHLLFKDKKLEAIKYVVQHTSMGLLDAKNYVEEIENNIR